MKTISTIPAADLAGTGGEAGQKWGRRRAPFVAGKFLLLLLLCLMTTLGRAAEAAAPAGSPPPDSAVPTIVANADAPGDAAHDKISLNLGWTLLTGFLVMLMQAGFALVAAGLCRAKNAAHAVTMNLMIYALAVPGFWAAGFGLMFGGYAGGPMPFGWQPSLGPGLLQLNHEITVNLGGHPFGILGGRGFFLNAPGFDSAVFCFFLFQAFFMGIAASIPIGAMVERWNFRNFMLYGFWVGALPFAIFGNWVWGGGWLAQLGRNFGLGHGHVDFAGSSVVHMCGGMIALAGAMALGPRLGKYGQNGRPRPIPGHNLVYVIVGTLILAFGWFGFNTGPTLGAANHRIALIAVNTLLASAAGALGACLVTISKFGKPDPSLLCNGLLAGLVAVSAACAFVSPAAAAIIGFVAGVIVVYSVFFIEGRLKIDDPVGAISIHGVNGAWGALSLGLFANGSYGAGWGGVHRLVKGGVLKIVTNDGASSAAEYGQLTGSGWTDLGVTGGLGKWFANDPNVVNDWSQFGAQCAGTLTCFAFVGAFAYAWFKISNLCIRLRSRREEEIAGLDLPEMGAECYPDYQVTDKSSPRIH